MKQFSRKLQNYISDECFMNVNFQVRESVGNHTYNKWEGIHSQVRLNY